MRLTSADNKLRGRKYIICAGGLVSKDIRASLDKHDECIFKTAQQLNVLLSRQVGHLATEQGGLIVSLAVSYYSHYRTKPGLFSVTALL